MSYTHILKYILNAITCEFLKLNSRGRNKRYACLTQLQIMSSSKILTVIYLKRVINNKIQTLHSS